MVIRASTYSSGTAASWARAAGLASRSTSVTWCGSKATQGLRPGCRTQPRWKFPRSAASTSTCPVARESGRYASGASTGSVTSSTSESVVSAKRSVSSPHESPNGKPPILASTTRRAPGLEDRVSAETQPMRVAPGAIERVVGEQPAFQRELGAAGVDHFDPVRAGAVDLVSAARNDSIVAAGAIAALLDGLSPVVLIAAKAVAGIASATSTSIVRRFTQNHLLFMREP